MMKTASQPTYLYVQRTYIVWFLYLLKNNKNTTPVFKFLLKKTTAFPWTQNRSYDSFPGQTRSSFSS